MDRQQVAETEDDVDLGRHEAPAMGEREHHDVDDAVGGLDLRPLIALQHVLDDERMQAQDRADGVDLRR